VTVSAGHFPRFRYSSREQMIPYDAATQRLSKYGNRIGDVCGNGNVEAALLQDCPFAKP